MRLGRDRESKRLLDPALDGTEAGARLARWGRLHVFRGAAGGAAFILLLLWLAKVV